VVRNDDDADEAPQPAIDGSHKQVMV